MCFRFQRIFALLVLAGGMLSGFGARAEPQLDLALVIAVDVSSSMEPEEQDLQRKGFVKAFRSALVHEVIQNGAMGRIAVTYVEWSGEKDQLVLVPWMVVDGAETANVFADRLAGKPVRQSGMTSISSAIDFGRKLFGDLKERPSRRVIDISGDGPNNDGRRVVDARDEAVAEGITINGLPIMFEREGISPEIEALDLYFKECVTGGLGSFVLPLHDAEQFAMVIRTKIMREIAEIGDPRALIVPARAVGVNCLTGETLKEEDPPSGQRKP